MHNSFLDFLMYWISYKPTWIPFYIFLLFLVIKHYKLRTLDVLVFTAFLITASDQLSVYCFKDVFHRLRPCHDPIIQTYVHLVNGECGGSFGFVSSHAANSFAICFFLIQILGKKIKYLTPGMIIWAAIVSYSRIYLGVHYPFDVFCGALLGMLVGYSVGKAFNWYYKKHIIKNSSLI